MTRTGFSRWINKLRCWFAPATRRKSVRRIGCSEAEFLETRTLPAAVIVTADPNLTTTESGGTATFTVQLSDAPKKAVKIPISSSNTAEGTVSTKLLVFTSANWNEPQTVTVKGVDDTVTDGDKTYSVMLGKVKGDKLYKKQDPADVTVVNQDNDQPGILVTAGSNLQTTEGGGTATFTIRLLSKPSANVTIPLQSSDTSEGSVTSSVTFTPSNWNKAQTVTITGVDDSQFDGDQTYQITIGPSQSSDSHYSGLTSQALSVVNHDNEVASLVVSPVSATSIYEGASQDISVKLSAQPTADVTVTLTETVGADQATLSTTTLTFTPENWNVAQHVTISATLGDGIDGDQAYAFTMNTTSDDPNFNALPAKTINATIVDTDGERHDLDGSYTGTYTGTVNIPLIGSQPKNGTVAFSVVGVHVTVTDPADATGTITGDSGTFAPTSGPLVGASFTGTFTNNGDGTVTVAGTWTYSHNGVTGSGTWSATRPAPG